MDSILLDNTLIDLKLVNILKYVMCEESISFISKDIFMSP